MRCPLSCMKPASARKKSLPTEPACVRCTHGPAIKTGLGGVFQPLQPGSNSGIPGDIYGKYLHRRHRIRHGRGCARPRLPGTRHRARTHPRSARVGPSGSVIRACWGVLWRYRNHRIQLLTKCPGGPGGVLRCRHCRHDSHAVGSGPNHGSNAFHGNPAIARTGIRTAAQTCARFASPFTGAGWSLLVVGNTGPNPT